jgi:hypothetical protein
MSESQPSVCSTRSLSPSIWERLVHTQVCGWLRVPTHGVLT